MVYKKLFIVCLVFTSFTKALQLALEAEEQHLGVKAIVEEIDARLLSVNGLDSISIGSNNVKLIINQKNRLLTDSIDSVYTTADGMWTIAGSLDGTVRLWSTKEKSQPFIIFRHTSPITSVTLNQTGKWALVGSTDFNAILLPLEDLQNIKPLILRGHSHSISSVALNFDCTCAMTTAENEPVRIWNLEDKENINSNYLPRERVIPKLSSDGRRTLVVDSEAAGGVVIAKLSSDGQSALTLDRENRLVILDLRDKKRIRPYILEGYTGKILAIDLSSNGLCAIAGGVDKVAWVWGLSNLDKISCRELRVHTKAISSVYMTPNAEMAITGSRDNTAAVWRLTESDSVPQLFVGHEDSITSVYLSPDGALAATGSADATAAVWDCEKAKKIITTKEQSRLIYFVFISSDKTIVLVASRDHTVQWLDLVTQNEMPRTASPLTASAAEAQ